jgi:uncharacterized protein
MGRMKILISGASGLVGSALVRSLNNNGHSLILLTRSPESTKRLFPEMETRSWDFVTPLNSLPEIDYAIHLAGEPIFAKRWSAHQKEILRSSRIVSTRELVNALKKLTPRPTGFLSASAIGFYGDRGDEVIDEQSAPGNDFLATLCRDWEKEALAASAVGIRTVCLRTGIVLAEKGGALGKMLPPFKLGLGGPIGRGKQWMSWIHIDDEIGLIKHALTNTFEGPMNLTAPDPVTNQSFSKALGEAVHRPAVLPTPALALKVMLGEVADVLTSSQRVVPRVAEKTRYSFKYPDLRAALKALV